MVIPDPRDWQFEPRSTCHGGGGGGGAKSLATGSLMGQDPLVKAAGLPQVSDYYMGDSKSQQQQAAVPPVPKTDAVVGATSAAKAGAAVAGAISPLGQSGSGSIGAGSADPLNPMKGS